MIKLTQGHSRYNAWQGPPGAAIVGISVLLGSPWSARTEYILGQRRNNCWPVPAVFGMLLFSFFLVFLALLSPSFQSSKKEDRTQIMNR